jgi:hypothetical protein
MCVGCIETFQASNNIPRIESRLYKNHLCTENVERVSTCCESELDCELSSFYEIFFCFSIFRNCWVLSRKRLMVAMSKIYRAF